MDQGQHPSAPVDIAVANAHRAVGWTQAHARGDVPDALPYGLDRLAERGYDLGLVGTARPGRSRRALGKLMGEVWLPSGRRRRPGAPLVAWDERAGVPHLLGRSDGPILSGCIWATEPDAPRRVKAIARQALHRARYVIVLSAAQVPVLLSWGIPEERVAVVPFGVDVDFWSSGRDVRTDEVFTCVAVGNDRRRDFRTLSMAWGALRRLGRDQQLVLAANRPVPDIPEARRIDVPHRELRDEVYGSADVSLVLTLDNLHGSGITSVLESMACRVPVVATDLPGMREYVRHMETGWLVPPGDVDSVVEAVTTLRSDRLLARRLAGNAKRAVAQQFTSATMAHRIGDLVDASRER